MRTNTSSKILTAIEKWLCGRGRDKRYFLPVCLFVGCLLFGVILTNITAENDVNFSIPAGNRQFIYLTTIIIVNSESFSSECGVSHILNAKNHDRGMWDVWKCNTYR